MIVSKVWNGTSFVNTDSDTVDGLHARSSEISLYKNVFMSGDHSWVYVAETDVTRFTIPNDIYTPDSDIVTVFYNGLRLVKGMEYELIGYDVILGFTLPAKDKVEFCVSHTSYNYNDLENVPAIGDLGLLNTLHKDTIVGAINEVSMSKANNVPWKNIVDKPLEYPPSSHFHNNIYYTKDQVDAIVDMASGTVDYEELQNKPKINGVTISGNLKTSDLKISTMQTMNIAIDKTDWAIDESDGMAYYSLKVTTVHKDSFSMFTPDRETLMNNYKHNNSYIVTNCRQGEIVVLCPFIPDYTVSGNIFITNSVNSASSLVGRAITGRAMVTGEKI